jgi:hypothetical protein
MMADLEKKCLNFRLVVRNLKILAVASTAQGIQTPWSWAIRKKMCGLPVKLGLPASSLPAKAAGRASYPKPRFATSEAHQNW